MTTATVIADKMRASRSPALLVSAVALWTIFYVVAGRNNAFAPRDMRLIEGCYRFSSGGEFEITQDSLVIGGSVQRVRGLHEKNRDVLVIDNPIKLRFIDNKIISVHDGNITKIPITYNPVISLELPKSPGGSIIAIKERCQRSYEQTKD